MSARPAETPSAAPAAPGPLDLKPGASRAEKARALLALLEPGGTPTALPEGHLRSLARDLIASVEARRDQPASSSHATTVVAGSAPAAGQAAAEERKPSPPAGHTSPSGLAPSPGYAAKLFSRSRPLSLKPGLPGSRVAKATPAPQQPTPAPAPAKAAPSRQPTALTRGRLTLSAPVPHRVEPEVGAEDWRVPPSDLRRLVSETLDPSERAREHPVVAAIGLLGRPAREQAAELRALPTGHLRAVHRALRQLEQGGPMTS